MRIIALSDVKKTRGRTRRPVVSADTEEWDAKIKAVTQDVLSRNISTPAALSSAAMPLQPSVAILDPRQKVTPTDSEAEVEAQTYTPGTPGKPKRSASKLRMSWAPEGFQGEAEPTTAPTATHVEPDPAITPAQPPSSTRTHVTSSVLPTSEKSPRGKKRRGSNELPCPVCLGMPFHLRYRCPVIEAGPDAIEKRLEELKEEDTGHHTLLIEELEQVIRNKRTRVILSKSGSSSSPGSFVNSAGNLLPMASTSSPFVKPSDVGSSSRKLTVPSGSNMSEVAVENNDEGSSNEGSDSEASAEEESDEDRLSEKQSGAYQLPPAFAGVSSLADVDLDAIIRGPASQSKSVLDNIPSRSISEDDDDDADNVLEEDDDDDWQYRLRSKKLEKNVPSDDEVEDSDVPGSGDASGGEEMEDVPPKTPTQPVQPLEDTSRTTQAGSQNPSMSPNESINDDSLQVVDGLSGSVGPSPMDEDDEERTEVAPSAENGEDTDESGLSIRKEKKALLAATLRIGSQLFQRNSLKDTVSQSRSPTKEAHPPEGVMNTIESIPHSTVGQIPENLSDPIEPADLMESTPRGRLVVEIGIRNRSLSQSPRKPGMVKRMKGRDGKIPSNGTAVDIEDAVLPAMSTPSRAVRTDSTVQSPSLGSGTRDNTIHQTEVESSSSADVMPNPPAPAVKEQRRRGRPPLSEEVKAAREKAKADAKAQRADEKARKDAAKQAEKGKKAQLRTGMHQARKTRSQKSTSQPLIEGTSTPEPGAIRDLDSPHSLDKWATINNPSSSQTPGTPSMMLDQLRSSSPGHPTAEGDDIQPERTDKQRIVPSRDSDNDQTDAKSGTPQDNPLFVLSSTQVPFPYSQWQGGSEQVEDTPTESESEDEALIKSKTTHRVLSSMAPKFRRLTDIASQAMFSQDILSPTPALHTPAISDKVKNQLIESDEEDDEDDDSGSDSDAKTSHIPKSRRAGASLRSKKSAGLSVFT